MEDKTAALQPSVEPIKIVIPVLSSASDVKITSPSLVQNVNLSQQPTVPAKIGDNRYVNVKIVTSAHLEVSPRKAEDAMIRNGDDSLVVRDELPPSPTRLTREQKQLQNSINSSKVLSDFISEGRKSRNRPKSEVFDGDESPMPARSVSRADSEASSTLSNGPKLKRNKSMKLDSRSGSPGSEINDDKSQSKRTNMRSANVDFVQKQQKFLQKVRGTSDAEMSDEDDKSDVTSTATSNGPALEDEREKICGPPPKAGSDRFCWRCSQPNNLFACSRCVRSYHVKCLKSSQTGVNGEESRWICPECVDILAAEKANKGKPKLDKEFLSKLLTFALNRFMLLKGAHHLNAAPAVADPNIVHEMTLEMLRANVEAKKYHSIEAFHADVKWLLHNANVSKSRGKFLGTAKAIMKTCKQEIHEIDTCFECYYKANTEENWFVDVCSRPHMLLWAKLKGFPFWPAKAMSVNEVENLVNVRFFGAHDRSWVPIKDCFLYSEDDPNGSLRVKRNEIQKCILEVNVHIEKLKEIYGVFKPAPFRTIFDPTRAQEQLKLMLPNYEVAQKPSDTTKLIEELVTGNKPKLRLKIFRTADNNLSAKTDNDDEIPGITKFKISTADGNRRNYQITPVTTPSSDDSSPASKGGQKRATNESWTIMGAKNKKQKTKPPEESEEQRKLELTASLQLRPRTQTPSLAPPPSVPRKKITPKVNPNRSLVEKSSTKVVQAKRRQTITGNVPEPVVESESPVVSEKRSLRSRHKSTAESPLSKEQSEKPSKETSKTTKKKTNSPPPLVPFTVIKSEPLSDDDVEVLQPAKERISVKDINTLTGSSAKSEKSGPSLASARNGAPTRTSNGMVYIPTSQQNGPAESSSESRRSSETGNNSTSEPSHALSGLLTKSMASAITDLIVKAPPQLTEARPSGALRSEGTTVFPSEAGPVSRILVENAHRMTDFFRTVIEDTLADMGSADVLQAKVRRLELEMEQMKQRHMQEVMQLKHNSDLILNELQTSMEREKAQIVNETRKQCDIERIRALEDAKRKQWCQFCLREARFHCCLHTWYCTTQCQQKDWIKHMPSCEHTRERTQRDEQRQKALQQQQQQQQQQRQKPVNRHPQPMYAPIQFGQQKHTPMVQQRSATAPQISAAMQGMVLPLDITISTIDPQSSVSTSIEAEGPQRVEILRRIRDKGGAMIVRRSKVNQSKVAPATAELC